MNKNILILCAILVTAQGQVKQVTTLSYDSNLAVRTSDYINLNRQQYAKSLQDCDTKLDNFREYFSGRVYGINLQLDMISSSIVQIEERLNPLELLSDFSKQCVVKYRSSIPTVAYTKTSITSCITQATNQINSMLSSPVSIRNTIQNYYTNYFEKEITNCGKNYDNKTSNYTSCITAVTTNTNTYFINNQKTFDTYMDTAECSAKANIKRAVDCSYNIQTRTISYVAEANVLINNCLLGKDECKPCDEAITCPEAYDFPVDYKNQTMLNPFYERENRTSCLILRPLL